VPKQCQHLHKPFVDYKENGGTGDTLAKPDPSSEASVVPKPEAMDIEQDVPKLDDEPDWRISYLQCLVDGVLPSDPAETQRLAHRAKTFVLLDRELYKCIPSRIVQ